MSELRAVLKEAFRLELVRKIRQEPGQWTIWFRDGTIINTTDPAGVIQDCICRYLDMLNPSVIVLPEPEEVSEEPAAFGEPAILEGSAVPNEAFETSSDEDDQLDN